MPILVQDVYMHVLVNTYFYISFLGTITLMWLKPYLLLEQIQTLSLLQIRHPLTMQKVQNVFAFYLHTVLTHEASIKHARNICQVPVPKHLRSHQ